MKTIMSVTKKTKSQHTSLPREEKMKGKNKKPTRLESEF